MKAYEAIIIGGGPAGSTCAWKLVAAGLKTLVLDRARFPRVKLCAGWVTPPVIQALDLDLPEYRRGHTVEEIRGFTVRRFGSQEIQLNYDSIVSYGIIRREFDHYLLQRSRADVIDGIPTLEIEREDGAFVINGSYRTPLLIGAGGHYCPVARYLGTNLQRESCISTQELEIKVEEAKRGDYRIDPASPLIVYCDDMRGYAWCFRKGAFVNIGIGRTQNTSLKKHLSEFLEQLVKRKLIPPDDYFNPLKFRGHAYKLRMFTPRTVVGDGVLLIGDAAGLAYNFSGEGIRPAVESALMAVQTIRQADGKYANANLEGYRRQLDEHFGRPLTGWPKRFVDYIPRSLIAGIGRQILSSFYLSRKILIDRWFLHR